MRMMIHSKMLRPMLFASTAEKPAPVLFFQDRGELTAFHREQVTVLHGAGADVLMFETLPCALEARAIAALLAAEFPAASALLSFSCKDEAHLNSGEPFAPAVAAIEGCSQILAVGVNCTPPHLIAPLLTAAAAVTSKPFVAYGNSGEEFTSAGAADNPS